MTASPREVALQALFTLISGAYAWQNTPARRLKMWSDVPAEQRPAFFQFEAGRDTYAWSNTVNPKRSVEARLFFYFSSSDANPGAQTLTAISDAIDAAMKPSGADMMLGRNTLGGAVFQARIKDVPFKEPGDLDGDGILIVQVEIILP